MKECGNCWYWQRDYPTTSGTCEKRRFGSEDRLQALCTSSDYCCIEWYPAGSGAIGRRWVDSPDHNERYNV